MAEREVAYLERRAAREVEMARRATCPAAVSAHHKMARAYVERADALRHEAQPGA